LWPDEQILRQYTCFVLKYEKNGGDRYALASFFGMSGFFITYSEWLMEQVGARFSASPPPFWDTTKIANTSYTFPFILDSVENLKNVNQKIINAKEAAFEWFNPLYSLSGYFLKNSYMIRFQILSSGAGLMGKSIADKLLNLDPGIFQSIGFEFCFGYALFGLGSSLYIKGVNPKLLDKKPLHEILGEKLENLLAKAKRAAGWPIPTPRPGLSDNLTDNYSKPA